MKNTTNLITSFLCVAAFFSACNDKLQPIIDKDRSPVDCISGRPFESIPLPLEIDSTEYCELVYSSQPFRLNDEVRFWLPQFCHDAGDSITFVNDDKEESHLAIYQKGLFNGYGVFTVSGWCPDDRQRYYVYTTELAAIGARITHLGDTLTMVLRNRAAIVGRGFINRGPELSFFHRGPDGITYPTMGFNFMENEPDFTSSFGLVYLDEFEISNERYFEVYTDTSFSQGRTLRLYYNKAYGLVSFTDYNGVSWKLK